LAFASGAHGDDGLLDYYSSGGPSACNNDNLFPDLVAPGLDSCTTQPGDVYYCSFGGTSSASPHTAGCVALVRQAAPWLTVDEVEQILRDAADDVDDGCGTPPESPDWNNKYGEGHLDCYGAVELLPIEVGTLTGMVYDADTSASIVGALVQASLSPTQTLSTSSSRASSVPVCAVSTPSRRSISSRWWRRRRSSSSKRGNTRARSQSRSACMSLKVELMKTGRARHGPAEERSEGID